MKFYVNGEEKIWGLVATIIALAISPLNSELTDDHISKLSEKTGRLMVQLEKDGALTIVSVNTGEHYNLTAK